MDREAWHAAIHGVAKSPDTTEQLNWTNFEQVTLFLETKFPHPLKEIKWAPYPKGF